MDLLVPIEISNIIYLERATVHLKDICNDYKLDFTRFCKFLKDRRGLLIGSCALACIDPECQFNDMDLLIFTEPNSNIRTNYKDFFAVFTIDHSEINVGKTPLLNVDLDEEDQPKYLYTFTYNDKKIDMSIANDSTINFIFDHFFFDVSKVCFDGEKWNIPYKNIQSFLNYKNIRILNPYDTYFDKVYSMCIQSISELAPIMNKFTLQPLKIKNPIMQSIYNIYQPYYSVKLSNTNNDKMELEYIFHMISLCRKLNNDTLSETIIKWRDAIRLYSPLNQIQEPDLEKILNNPDELDDPLTVQYYTDRYTSKKQINELFRYYKGIYKILEYIGKGYIITNIKKYINFI